MSNSFAPLDPVSNGPSTKKRVAYFYDSDVGNYAYVAGHPMKPHRIRLAHSLIMNYGVYQKMEIYRAKPATRHEMTQFHTDEYIDFLQKVTPDNMESYAKEQGKYNVGDDCPVFDGLFEFCGISAGGSMEGAARLNRGKCDIAINWAGGLHHAKKSEASGFCYVNDIVLGIIELLRFKKEFSTLISTCIMYGEYFPGTGELRDIGVGQGKNYAVNFPLRDGIDDVTYKSIFEPVIQSVMDYYQPEAIVLQCGGDSLSGDRLGCFNLSMRGHANCVQFVKSFNKPTLVLGGGGYTMRNVARTWAFETGVLVGKDMDPILPYNEYYEYYGPDYELDVRASNMENANSKDYLEKIKIQVIENLKRTAHAPSVQMQDVPRTTLAGTTDEDEDMQADADEDENMDVRLTQHRNDKHVARDDEYDDGDEVEANLANGAFAQNVQAKQRNHTYSDVDMDSGVATPEVETHNEIEDAPATVTEANAQGNAELMEQKIEDAAPTETLEVGDVDMTEPADAATVASPPEPSDKPPASPTASVKANIATNVEASTGNAESIPEATIHQEEPIVLKEEGETERQDADVKAEENKEITEQVQS
ncbi:hypothetical protein DID88_008599 [Monilinia fructigena]|uniref:histone deacetylase n=1 Tax=Monilinia fructigena TaxID=38457 RepID=A0A395J6X7_9HELO|nr:hypothetical protein DID88_008599 [Monilinia fructigena]